MPTFEPYHRLTSAEIADVMRRYADIIESRPHLAHLYPILANGHGDVDYFNFYTTVGGYGDVDVDAFLSSFAKIDKRYDDDELVLTANVDGLPFKMNVRRDVVCEPRTVGTQTVTKRVLVQPAIYEEQQVEEPVVEWDCKPLLARASED